MTLHYNRTGQREKRRSLRHNATEAERRLWFHLRGKQLGVKFRRQYSVDGFVVDLYAPRCKLAVEVDGNSHFTDHGAAYDRERTNCLATFGVEVIRFTNTEILEHINAVVDQIADAVRRESNLPWPLLAKEGKASTSASTCAIPPPRASRDR